MKRLALISPPWFSAEMDQQGARYFQSQAFEVVHNGPAGLPSDQQAIQPSQLYEWVRTHTPKSAEAVFIGGNGVSAIGVIQALEENLDRPILTANGGAAIARPLSARAQQAGKIHKIGYLSPDSPSAVITPFFDALRELGWIEGQNVTFEYRYAENRLERLPELAAELVRLNVDVIVARGTLGPLAAKQASSTIPIVMTAAGDPLGSGLVASLARPGGNVTGMSLMAPDLGGKRLELLKEVLPRLARVAVLWNAANPYPPIVFKETQTAGRILGIEVQSLEVRGPDDFDGIFEAARRRHPEALITVEDPLTVSHRKRIADFAAGQQLPSLHGFREFVAAGGLISYGASLADLYRRAAGCKPLVLFEGRDKENTAFLRRISLKCDDRADITIVVPDDKTKPVMALLDTERRNKIDGIVLDERRSGKWNTSFWNPKLDDTFPLRGTHPDGALLPVAREPRCRPPSTPLKGFKCS